MQLALALGHLHAKNIVYRDLKPENVLVGEDGYVALIDFGISKRVGPGGRAKSFCGTPEYLAPEMLKKAGHSYTLDWWTLGVLAYEMMVGFPPFFAGQETDEQMFKLTRMILENDVFWPNEEEHQISMSDDCKDFIGRCLRKDPKERLGAKGTAEVLGHPWFSGLDQQKLLSKEIPVPEDEKPVLSADPLDLRYFDDEFTAMPQRESIVDAKAQRLIQKCSDQFAAFDEKN